MTTTAPRPVRAAVPSVVPAPAAEPPVPEGDGPAWKAVIAVEGVPTGDSRYIRPGALTWRDLPLSVKISHDDDGVFSSVARIDTITREEGTAGDGPDGPGNLIHATGMFDTGTLGVEAARLVRAGMIRGVSMDLDAMVVESDGGGMDDLLDLLMGDEDMLPEPDPDAPEPILDADGYPCMVVSSGQIAAVSFTATPAFEQALIEMTDAEPVTAAGDPPMPDAETDTTPVTAEDVQAVMDLVDTAMAAVPSDDAHTDIGAALISASDALDGIHTDLADGTLDQPDLLAPLATAMDHLVTALDGLDAAEGDTGMDETLAAAHALDGLQARLLGQPVEGDLLVEQGDITADASPGKGNARALIDWYEHGAGAAIIAYGTPGQFDRCVALAAPHMTSPEGFCSNRILAVTGQRPSRGHAVTAAAPPRIPVPKGVAAMAQKGLEVRADPEQVTAGTDAGVRTARTLAKGMTVPQAKVREVSGWFARHDAPGHAQTDSDGNLTAHGAGRMLWGGDPGKTWAMRECEKMNRAAGASVLASITDVHSVRPVGSITVTSPQPVDSLALVASGFPVDPPAAWFTDPGLTDRTPLTIEDSGEVFGHIATWRDEQGRPMKHLATGQPVPHSRTGYGHFHRGRLRTSEGRTLQVGNLTLQGGHAASDATVLSAQAHYDDPASVFAQVTVGEDAHGIWCHGAVVPDLTPGRLRQARAHAPSGDWRWIGGGFELVGACQVVTQGFPNIPSTTYTLAASGAPISLIAVGAMPAQEPWERAFHALQAEMTGLVERTSPAALAASVASEQRRAELRARRSLRAATDDPIRVGTFVTWDASGGTASGKVTMLVTDGPVPGIAVTVTGSPDSPAAQVEVWQETDKGWMPTDTLVGHLLDALTVIDPLPQSAS